MAHPRVLPVAIPALLLVASFGFLSGLGLAGTSDHLVISEVMYDPPQATGDTSYEWFETQ